MPSSPSCLPSSPPLGSRRSQFTYRQLAQMATYSTATPLRVITHIDLDAFYAQCEMVRLGAPEDKPLAVQQWQGLIAVNYAARKWGIGRHCTITEARKLCPDLIAQHVATWREGDDKWAYRDDAAANIATDKVSLDPYRMESRKILALLRESLPNNMQKLEKAGIDEVFIDLSAQVHAEMLRRCPELMNPPPYDDATEFLPLPSIAALDWKADALVDLEEEQEAIDPDWDDVAICLGSEIVRDLRAQVRAKLGYTCSGGIANNKLLSKLGSAYKKPNQQTVVRNRAVASFLAGIKVTKMRNLGGKLGDQVVSTFNTENIEELVQIPLDQMKAKFGEDTGLWVYNTIRGIDHSEVNSRSQIKSMLAAKSFRPSINTTDQAIKWLRIFVAEIYSRLVEEGVLENKRRPRTINLHHRHTGQTRSRQSPISSGKVLDEEALFNLAKDLLFQIISEGNVWPCANLSLSVGGFEDGVKGNMGIGAFLVKGEEATSLRTAALDDRPSSSTLDRPKKKARQDEGGIQRFFAKQPSTESEVVGEQESPQTVLGFGSGLPHPSTLAERSPYGNQVESPGLASAEPEDMDRMSNFACPRCQDHFDDWDSLQSHQDWHFAKDLHDEERVKSTFVDRTVPSRSQIPKGAGASSKRGRGGGGKMEQGQSKLKFG